MADNTTNTPPRNPRAKWAGERNQHPQARHQTNIDDDSPTKVSSQDVKQVFNISMFNRMVNIVDNLTMSRLKQIFNTAESGDLGDLIDVYLRMESADTRIQGMVNNRRLSVSQTDFVLTSGAETAEAENARELVQRNIDRLNWKEFRKDLMDGRFYGVAMFEKIWQRMDDGTILIDRVEQVDHTKIRQNNNPTSAEDDLFGELYIREGFNIHGGGEFDEIFMDDVSPFKLIVATNSGRKALYDLAGIMRPVARWFVIKTFLAQSWAQFAETYGFPVPIVKMTEDDYDEYKSTVKNMLESVGVNKYGIFFDRMEYELHQASGATSIEVFEKYMKMCNKEMAIGILGQNLTTDVEGGSRAATETHFRVLEALIEDDIDWEDEIIQQQFVNEIVRVNFPNLPIEDYPNYRSILKRSIDLEKKARGLRQLSQLIEIPTEYIYQETQIPKPEEDEDTIGGFEPQNRNLFRSN